MTPGKRDVSPISQGLAVFDQRDRKTGAVPSERDGSKVENSVATKSALETIDIENARYDRITEWRRDKTIPWDLAFVTGTLTADIGPSLRAGTPIFGKHMTRQAWADLQRRAI